MRSLAVVEIAVAGERRVDFSGCLVSMQIDLLVLDAAPQPLDEHVDVATCAVIGYPGVTFFFGGKRAPKASSGSLSALVR